MKKILISFLSILFLFGFALKANAATLFFVPESKTAEIGDEFFIDVKAGTEGIFINASQVQVTFPKNILEVKDFDKSNSVFNFWAEDPTFSNSDGTVKFVGGTSKGVSGESLQILRLKFKVIGTGSGEFNMVESVVTANDGKGTNVLSQIKKAGITAKPSVVGVPKTSEVVETPKAPVVIEVPKKVERVAVQVSRLPAQPKLRVPLYPDSEKWFSYNDETVVFWEVPSDVVKVAVSVDGNPKSTPSKAEEELLTGKKLGILGDGVHYIHVQFKNNQGWGEVAHYRVAIDVTPPVPFEIFIDSKVSDNPTPQIEFEGADSLSGYESSFMSLDGENRISLKETSFKLPSQKPGIHKVSITVFDKAGNNTESTLSFEILPLETPVVDYITDKISQGEMLFISGTSFPGGTVEVNILKGDLVVFKQEVNTDNSGNWKTTITEELKKDNYTVVAIAHNEKGASSYPTESIKLRVVEKIILSIGFIDLGWVEIFIIFVLFVLTGSGFGYWYYNEESNKELAYKVVVSRDVVKLANLLIGDLEKLEELTSQRSTPKLKIEFKNRVEEMKNNITKMKKYLGQEIGKL